MFHSPQKREKIKKKKYVCDYNGPLSSTAGSHWTAWANYDNDCEMMSQVVDEKEHFETWHEKLISNIKISLQTKIGYIRFSLKDLYRLTKTHKKNELETGLECTDKLRFQCGAKADKDGLCLQLKQEGKL